MINCEHFCNPKGVKLLCIGLPAREQNFFVNGSILFIRHLQGFVVICCVGTCFIFSGK